MAGDEMVRKGSDPNLALSASERQEHDDKIEQEVFERMHEGQSDADIIVRMRLAPRRVQAVRELYNQVTGKRAAAPRGQPTPVVYGTPQMLGGMVGGQGFGMLPDARRRWCACGAAQSEHVAGEGACARTFCRAFELPDAEEG